MFVALPGLIGSGSGGSFPPYGTWLSSVCSGPDAHDQGNGDYYDANGNLFQGMFTLWEQFADGAGGSYWNSYGNNAQDGRDPNTACWLPAYFYFENSSSTYSFDWSGCGEYGTFEYGSSYSYSYSNGDGSVTSGGGGGNWYTSGQLIYDGGCCVVYYDGSSGYYVSDNCGGGGGCPGAGTYLGDGCGSTDGFDASGAYFSGGWQYGSFWADGNCGSNFIAMGTNGNGCYYPAGWRFDYSSSSNDFGWTVYDSSGGIVGYGSFTYSSYWHSDAIADGSGNTYSGGGDYQAYYGQLIASGTYTDPGDGLDYYYEVRYDGMNGYYVTQSPV